MKSTLNSYLIVGNGKLSKHFQHLFTSKHIPYKIWTRDTLIPFESFYEESERILLLIKDDEIVRFIEANKPAAETSKIWIHCSGNLSTPLAEGAHPLMTFSDKLYDLNIYDSIVFITEKNRLSFSELFPHLTNPNYQIEAKDKVLYHAFCVMSGNFTTILWQYFFDFLISKDIPRSVAYLYLEQISNNLKSENNPLTGPIQRNDFDTIYQHLEALETHPLRNVYISFLEAYDELKVKVNIENN